PELSETTWSLSLEPAMPGITGIIGRGPPEGRHEALDLMVRVMQREAFYSSGVYRNERLGLAAAWVVHQGGFSDCNAVWNETKDIGLIFTGEEFSDPADISALRAKGHQFHADDASCLVHWYEELGPAFVERLNGWFSGLLVDLRQQQVILFNDRYGLSRIYYYENADGIYFATEAKSLLRVLPGVRQIDPDGLAEFSACGCVLQNRTLFPGVRLLPPASRWTFSQGQLERKEIYFQKETWESQPRLSEAEY